jgi:hypothetical protein
MAAPGLGLPVGDVAQLILDGVVSHFEAAAVDLPRRRIIAPGAPELIAFDCAMLAVTCSGVGQGYAPGQGVTQQRGGNPISAMGLRHAVFSVTLLRDEPKPRNGGQQPPPAEELTRAGLSLMRDMGLLSQALIEVCTRVAGGLPKGATVSAGAVNTIGPEGGFHGLQGTLAATAGLLA